MTRAEILRALAEKAVAAGAAPNWDRSTRAGLVQDAESILSAAHADELAEALVCLADAFGDPPHQTMDGVWVIGKVTPALLDRARAALERAGIGAKP